MDPARNRTRPSEQDSLYSWVVCACTGIVLVIHCGVLYSMGVFYIMFREQIDGDKSAMALAPALNMGMYFLIGPVAGILVERYGERIVATSSAFVATLGFVLTSFATNVFHLYLTYSITLGVGMGISFVAFMVALGRYFSPPKRGVATGIAVCGCGLGTLVYPPIIQALEDHYGWRGAMLILSGLLLNSVVCGAILRPYRTRTDVIKPAGAAKYKNEAPLQDPQLDASVNRSLYTTLPSLVRNVKFVCLCVSMTLFTLAEIVIITHLADYAMSLGFTEESSVFLYSIRGGSGTVFRFLAGLATLLPEVDSLRLSIVATLILGVTTVFLPQFKSWAGHAVYACIFGGFASPYSSMKLPNTAAVVDADQLAPAFGVYCFFVGPGPIFGGPLSASVSNLAGNRVAPFYVAGGIFILAGLLLLPTVCLPSRKKEAANKKQEQPTEL